ncbi:hypothetical protein [Neptunomonas sp.]|uniref:hypothetical protein n=1 Tax=Neptunomonas sp. TaxID=1971898 RepID=UPI0025E72084|nr:hypothetical protein [Neptunomonas sp.]
MNYEQKLLKDLKKNENVIQVLDYDLFVKEWEARKGTLKTGAGFAAPAGDSIIAAKLLKEFGFDAQKVTVKTYAGKKYVIFKGYPGQREIFKGTRYLAQNPQVVRMAVGPKGIVSSVKSGFVLSVVLSVGIEVFDYVIRDDALLSELLGTITSDLIKIGLSSIAAAVAGLAVGSAAILGSVAAAPLIAAIAVGIVTGLVLEKIDRKLGATSALIKAYEKMGLDLREMKYEFNRNLNYLERNPHMISCLFGPCSARMY